MEMNIVNIGINGHSFTLVIVYRNNVLTVTYNIRSLNNNLN